MDDIRVDGTEVWICGFRIDDASLAQLLSAYDAAEWPDVVVRAISVGAHTLLTAGVAVDLGDVDATVRRAVAEATAEAQRLVTDILARAQAGLAADLDPAHRESLVAQVLHDLEAWRVAALEGLDPTDGQGAGARLIESLAAQLDDFHDKLAQTLDPQGSGSGFSALTEQMDARFRELFTELGRHEGRREEARLGTAKGIDFEDAVEARLRELGRAIGAVVERTSRSAGTLGGAVGDFTVSLPTGRRIVVEAKNTTRLGLSGANGILAELERALANRDADVAICVSAQDAFPAEVGSFGHFGRAVLVVDDGSGELLDAAVRWAAALAEANARDDTMSVATVSQAMERIRVKAKQLSDAKRALTEIGKSVAAVGDMLADLRRDLLELVEETTFQLRRQAA